MNQTNRHPAAAPHRAIPLGGARCIRIDMDKPTNGYYATINKWSNGEIVKIMGPYKTMQKAESVGRGMEINLHDNYYTYSEWFGPDIEPTEQSG